MLGWTLRGALHLTVWASVGVPTAVELARGWRPYGDDAAIASRAYQVLSLHPPLVGLASAASNHTGHEIYGLGPLLFYLLAVPVRIDPAQGLLWGAALWCALVLSVALEAAWRSRQWPAVLLVVVGVLDVLWRTPSVLANVAWNASFPLPFLLASLVLCWVVGVGARRWWPVLVACASVAAQCHLFYAIPAFLLVATGLVLGLRGGDRHGWLLTGVAVGALCWLAPVVQQLTAAHGNLGTVLASGGGQHTLGVTFALRDLAMAGGPRPLWLTRRPVGFFPLAALETAYPAWYGGALLAGLLLVVLGAWRTGRDGLAGLAAGTLATAVGLVASLAIFPAKNILSLGYLVVPFWILGVALWLLAGWTVLVLISTVLGRRQPVVRVVGVVTSRAWIGPAVALLGLAGVAGAGVVGGSDPAPAGWSVPAVTTVGRAAAAIERVLAPGPVTVAVIGGDFYTTTWSTEALAFCLRVAGWRPGTTGPSATYTGFVAQAGAPRFVVRLRRGHLVGVRRLANPRSSPGSG